MLRSPEPANESWDPCTNCEMKNWCEFLSFSASWASLWGDEWGWPPLGKRYSHKILILGEHFILIPPHCNGSHFSLVQPCDKGWQLHKGTTLIAFNFSPAVEGSGAHFVPPEDRELFSSRSFLNLDYFMVTVLHLNLASVPWNSPRAFNDNTKKKTQNTFIHPRENT